MKISLAFSLLFLLNNSFGQNNTIIIFSDTNNYLSNPYLDLLRIESEQSKDIFIDWQDCPDFYFLSENGDTVTLLEKINQKLLENADTTEYVAYCKIFVDWQGKIREISLIKTEGDINISELKLLFEGIKAIPLKRFEYGIDSKCVIPIRKNVR